MVFMHPRDFQNVDGPLLSPARAGSFGAGPFPGPASLGTPGSHFPELSTGPPATPQDLQLALAPDQGIGPAQTTAGGPRFSQVQIQVPNPGLTLAFVKLKVVAH